MPSLTFAEFEPLHRMAERMARGLCRRLGLPAHDAEDFAQDLLTDLLARLPGFNPDQEARAIYRAHYWNGVHGDELPVGVDLAVFDGAVNSSRRRAALWLQEALGVTADGAIGPRTLRAARGANDRAALVERICDLRLAFLRGLDTWPEFGRGWNRRVRGVRQAALAMASGA